MSSLFVCDQCDCVDCLDLAPKPTNGLYLCSLCHPLSRRWHGEFPRETYNPQTDTIVCNRVSSDAQLSLG